MASYGIATAAAVKFTVWGTSKLTATPR
jgi:hypothetical protein